VYRSGRLINPATDASVPFTLHDTVTDVLAVPGDFSTAIETIAGGFVVTLLGVGTVSVGAGRIVSTVSDGTVAFQAGPGVLTEWFVNGGSPEGPSAICAALDTAS